MKKKSDPFLEEFLEVGIEAARKAGEIILGHAGRLSRSDIASKRTFDFVTQVDLESEQAVIRTIRERFPDHLFYTEESLKESREGGCRWIVDPLDGTTNFIHGYPVLSVSIALERDGEVVVGVIYDPLRSELFTAVKGEGARLDGRELSVSPPRPLNECVVLTGFPFRMKEHTSMYLEMFRNIFLKVGDLRRCGSAALDLAYVAAGRGDGFFEIGLGAWDVAAGSLMVREAGGLVTDFGGGPGFLSTGNIVAGGPAIHALLLEEIRSVCRGVIDR
jgi:myo-inositol-1(or 4)-monophosphatase